MDSSWYGLVAPAAIPPAILNKIQAAAAGAALSSDDLKAPYAKQDAVASPTTPAEFVAVTAERAKWTEVVAVTGMKLD